MSIILHGYVAQNDYNGKWKKKYCKHIFYIYIYIKNKVKYLL